MSGWILHQTHARVTVATHPTTNSKTGDMIQVWILGTQDTPLTLSRQGRDSVVCGQCPKRHSLQGDCYVNIWQAPQAVYHAWRNGVYGTLRTFQADGRHKRVPIRWGAYGDPAFIPYVLLARLSDQSIGWTGYTHQWQQPHALRYARYLMASCDTPEQAELAQSQGWRTFRTRYAGSPLTGEITCPASLEAGHKTDCSRCQLCDGNSSVSTFVDPRKSITILAHGARSQHLIRIGE